MPETDVLYMTRIQKERFDSEDDYNKVHTHTEPVSLAASQWSVLLVLLSSTWLIFYQNYCFDMSVLSHIFSV